MTIVTRRRLIGGLAAIPAFAPGAASATSDVSIPVVEAQPLPAATPECAATETALAKINRLATELAEALDQWAQGRNPWHIVVPRTSTGRPWYMITEAPSYGLRSFARTGNEW